MADTTTTKTAKTVTKINPFGKAPVQRSSTDILQENFGIGITDFDRGADEWDADRVDEKTGKPAPGWVHKPNTSLECVIVFSVNEGKGTGRQEIPASEFLDYVEALQGIIDSDYTEPVQSDRTEYIPTYTVARQSFKMVRPKVQVTGADGKVTSVEDTEAERDIVSVRCTGGKGAKPMLVSKSEFPAVVGMLSQIAANLEDYEATAWERYNATKTTVTPEAGSNE